MGERDTLQRSILPIPETQHVGLTTSTPRIPTPIPADRAVAAAEGRAQRPRRPDQRLRVRRVERIRRAHPDAERRTAGGERAQVQPLSHDRVVLAHAPGAAHRAQPSFREHGRCLRDRDIGPRLHLGAAEEQGAARHDAQAQWLLDRAVRQMSRSANLGNEPDGAVRPVAHRRRRVRVLLRLHRRRDHQWYPAIYEGTTPMEQGCCCISPSIC